jgi:hypothetical protein
LALALWLPVFPYYRLAPLLLATWGLFLWIRKRTPLPLLLAFISASVGLLWSLDVGTYAIAGLIAAVVIVRPPLKQLLLFGAIAAAIPILILLAMQVNLRQFFVDAYLILPKVNNAAGALPAPELKSAAGLRYYLPPVFYGLLLALAWKRRDPRIAIVAIFSILLFRTAAGRVGWSHTRVAIPFLGIAFVGFILEPLRNRIAVALLALAALFYFEVPQNALAGARLLAQWPSRQRHEGLVRHPLARGIYTSEDNAIQLSSLKSYVDALGPGTIFDFTNERALYFMLRRKPPTRCFDVPTLSSPVLLAEAMQQLNAHPPVAVILGGEPSVAVFDGVSNAQRVPLLAQWIDANYPQRTTIGRFIVATR